MTKAGKLIDKLKATPKTFKWAELEKVLTSLGFEKLEGAGSRVKFYNKDADVMINLHKPHPKPELKAYQVKQVVTNLKDGGLL